MRIVQFLSLLPFPGQLARVLLTVSDQQVVDKTLFLENALIRAQEFPAIG